MKVYTYKAFKLKERILWLVDNIGRWEDLATCKIHNLKNFGEVSNARQRIRQLKLRFKKLFKRWNSIKSMKKTPES